MADHKARRPKSKRPTNLVSGIGSIPPKPRRTSKATIIRDVGRHLDDEKKAAEIQKLLSAQDKKLVGSFGPSSRTALTLGLISQHGAFTRKPGGKIETTSGASGRALGIQDKKPKKVRVKK